ncbi:MAG: cation transporter [Bacteroidales bacterium]|nr:cation transporter [Bacteroidales bacterium]MDT8431944.1 cation transporter [Bacteroidales bacterium]
MKKIFVLLVAALLTFACNPANKSENEASAQEEVNVENLVEVVIPVHGMTCEGCENAVKTSISSLEGIAEVTASHTDSIATVKYDKTAVTRDEIELKIADAGYVVAAE